MSDTDIILILTLIIIGQNTISWFNYYSISKKMKYEDTERYEKKSPIKSIKKVFSKNTDDIGKFDKPKKGRAYTPSKDVDAQMSGKIVDMFD